MKKSELRRDVLLAVQNSLIGNHALQSLPTLQYLLSQSQETLRSREKNT